MKYYLLLKLCLLVCLSNFSWATQLTTPLDYLKAMQQAHRQLNYELLYIIQKDDDVESLRYRHAFWEGKEFAQLLRLDYAREEIILRDDIVGYFGEFQPFSLQTNHIIDNLPSVLHSQFSNLDDYYFVDAGKMRTANRLARVIRIVPRDDFRYQYELWIDEENHLLLRSDLLDRDRQVLEQFRVIQSGNDEQLLRIVEPINALLFPTLLSNKPQEVPAQVNWRMNWVPRGFKPIESSPNHLTLFTGEQVESQRYSDGLFSFTVYFAENKGVTFDDQFWREGKTSIYSQTVDQTDIIIIGDIPLVSARHILQKIEKIQPLVEKE